MVTFGLLNRYRRRKERMNVSAFDALLSTPEGAVVQLPASGRFRVRSDAGCLAGATACTIQGASLRTIQTPALAAGGHMNIDHIEADYTVTLEAGFELLLDVGFGLYAPIASAI